MRILVIQLFQKYTPDIKKLCINIATDVVSEIKQTAPFRHNRKLNN